ncbi:bifunctional methylenetetrahydrofolate dehydrogenase/methenyltetrahydrofolate cyclohydrolase FolD [Desulfocurvibacter africanus]|uniref:Bifunctional protein FolD n=1 Tax=Desulfocurvibacter africanus subsp. africanus str. Walvis Bay TaxID=690850 RepID=F3YUE4_DESAF|nr:bifunctional methylenetetrahydrofolate dehydrogenase/methenyltetrahydrofolate cyclohydrolase FolD [Desulfocurvibacter africanus]EGJ48826.1 Bifunctional protein folD [Desulfocurvibacter africanus subsp. africanus str. Walvis Bay]
MKLIDGKATAQTIREELKTEVAALKDRLGRAPGLAVVLVGEDPASQVYVRNKIKACEDTGIVSKAFRPEASVSQAELEDLVRRLNADPELDGILVQLPLPRGLDSQRILDLIDPAKDVDGFHPVSMGRLTLGLPGLRPCTPAGVMELLRRYDIPTKGKKAVVVGRSNIVGKPMALLLAQPGVDATVTLCHSRTRDLAAECRQADILVAAIGKANFITADMIKDGAVVIDVGMNRTEKGLAGDCDFHAMKDKVAAITPVPGGVGPMTIAMLMVNTLAACRRRMGLES